MHDLKSNVCLNELTGNTKEKPFKYLKSIDNPNAGILPLRDIHN